MVLATLATPVVTSL